MSTRRMPMTEAIMREMGERLRAISDSVDSEFREYLTRPQRATLDSLRRNQVMILKRKTPDGTAVDTIRRP